MREGFRSKPGAQISPIGRLRSATGRSRWARKPSYADVGFVGDAGATPILGMKRRPCSSSAPSRSVLFSLAGITEAARSLGFRPCPQRHRTRDPFSLISGQLQVKVVVLQVRLSGQAQAPREGSQVSTSGAWLQLPAPTPVQAWPHFGAGKAGQGVPLVLVAAVAQHQSLPLPFTPGGMHWRGMFSAGGGGSSLVQRLAAVQHAKPCKLRKPVD